MLMEITNVRVAAQKPKQLVNNGFDVELFRRKQRKPGSLTPQIKACLRAED
jgi:hypothetical protein